jgi:hypothetical protein
MIAGKWRSLMESQRERVADVFRRVDATLQAARHGYDDLIGRDTTRRNTGLRNLIVSGRSITFVLQNLRSVLNDGEFDYWYGPQQDQLRAEPLMRFFIEVRNELEKQGKLDIVSKGKLNFSTSDLDRIPRPPGAEEFFISDDIGGSGWLRILPDGSEEKYYVDLPSWMGKLTQHFKEVPAAIEKEYPGLSVDDLCLRYLNRLTELVRQAKAKFMPSNGGSPGGRQTHLRVVK